MTTQHGPWSRGWDLNSSLVTHPSIQPDFPLRLPSGPSFTCPSGSRGPACLHLRALPAGELNAGRVHRALRSFPGPPCPAALTVLSPEASGHFAKGEAVKTPSSQACPRASLGNREHWRSLA